jgi:hypothetical protein
MIVPVYAIKAAVATSYGVPEGALVSSRRSRAVSVPRFAAFRLCRDLTPLSLPAIGRHFGGRDHTTVMYGLDRADELLAWSAEFAEKYRAAAALVPKIDTPGTDAEAAFSRCAELFKQMAKAHGYLLRLERE